MKAKETEIETLERKASEIRIDTNELEETNGVVCIWSICVLLNCLNE